ncbi:MAG TPA: energy transducer TonB [Pyrinomonadaceae bacterium]|nr:energy transducer TonB [Pyrinomonadaceae bacterium]
MLSNANRILTAVGFASLLAVSVTAQTANWAEWEAVQPDVEEFTVQMPKNSSTEKATFPYHKMELTVRLYMAATTNGPVVAVASFNGIKSNPALYTEFARLNSYVDAFKTWFPSKVRPATAPVKLTMIASNLFHGYTSRQYKMSIGDLNGTVHAIATKKRFYTIVSLNTKKDDALEEKFLSSFYVPDRPPDTPAVASQPGNEQVMPETSPTDPKAGDAAPPATAPNNAAPTESGSDTPANPQTPQSPQTNSGQGTRDANAQQQRAPISGGVLNGKAIYLPQPELPAGDAPTGTVMVQVLVDEQGSVVSARAVSGPPALHMAAVNAARLARFTTTMLMGEPVKVSGTLVYNFVRSF